MGENRPRKIQVYAVVRLDLFLENLENPERLEQAVSVKEVVPTVQEAEAEVQRLNSDKDVRYFWQATRYFPDRRKPSEASEV